MRWLISVVLILGCEERTPTTAQKPARPAKRTISDGIAELKAAGVPLSAPEDAPGNRIKVTAAVPSTKACDALEASLKDLRSPPDCLELVCIVSGTTAPVFDKVGFAKHWFDRGIDKCPDNPF